MRTRRVLTALSLLVLGGCGQAPAPIAEATTVGPRRPVYSGRWFLADEDKLLVLKSDHSATLYDPGRDYYRFVRIGKKSTGSWDAHKSGAWVSVAGLNAQASYTRRKGFDVLQLAGKNWIRTEAESSDAGTVLLSD